MRKMLNFSAGPAMLPEEVLLQAQAEMLDWNNTGASVMEIGHRGPEFKKVAEESEADLRELMQIPNHYQILFLSGGATHQFAMIPMNLLRDNKKADYVDTGVWSKKAIAEAKNFGDVKVVAELVHENNQFYIPTQDKWTSRTDAAYLHYTPNETIEGIEFQWVPQTGKIPLIADMTSMILSRHIDVNQYGLIYAGAQKNLGQAGITIVIIREDLIKEPIPGTPTLYRYHAHAENKSFYNTPPTYAWYITGLVLKWMKKKGGISNFEAMNKRKAKKLYDVVDGYPEFYMTHVAPTCRSLMNVVFNLKTPELTEKFLLEATQKNFRYLKGHRLVGGVRASIYNAMPEEAVDGLVEFMQEFAEKNG